MITSRSTTDTPAPRPSARQAPDSAVGHHAEAGPDPLLARHRRVLPSWVTPYYDQPLALSHGSGRHVTDTRGHTYLDFFAGILTNSLGYDLPEFREALHRQLATGLTHTSTLYLIEAQVRLAERLAELSGLSDPAVFLVSSGTEANDAALLAALCRAGNNHVIALRDGYHGRSLSTTAVTGLPGWRPSPYSPLRVTLADNGATRPGETRTEADDDIAVRAVREALENEGDAAALIVEPVQGLGGFHTPPSALLRRYEELVRDSGGVLISDEVQTAWGRTGQGWWGYQLHGLRPDALTFAKGIAGGLPMGGLVAERALLDSLPGKSISTFGGNPLSCTAALVTLDVIRDRDLLRNADEIGSLLLARMRTLEEGEPHLTAPRGHGLMLAVDLIEPGSGNPAPATARAFVSACRDLGLLIGLGGPHGNSLRIAPPLTVNAEEARAAATVLEQSAAATRPTG
ncbi:aspartate aminotransferase family protein [Streptomyces sp. NPDC058701]|uniref:aspartate aminotransferase family protein n=1 Tax=Streptomyces sp. NPDC058701 TaxID=3346608 RepID=UPI003650E300